jgi:hypothetical protein
MQRRRREQSGTGEHSSGLFPVLAAARQIGEVERDQASRIREGQTLRQQTAFDDYLAQRAADPSCTFRQHLRRTSGAIEEWKPPGSGPPARPQNYSTDGDHSPATVLAKKTTITMLICLVKGLSVGVTGRFRGWRGECFYRSAGCGQDREGPLRVEGGLLLGHAASRSGWGPGTADGSLAGQHECGSRLAGQAAPGVLGR